MLRVPLINQIYILLNKDLLYYWQPTDAKTRLIHRGDVIQYNKSHISTVYSKKWGLSEHGGKYDIIHAFSWECSDPNSQKCRKYPWFRKVGVTANNHRGLKKPSGFGRIRLWN